MTNNRPRPLFVYSLPACYEQIRWAMSDGWHLAAQGIGIGSPDWGLLQTTDRALAATRLDDSQLEAQEATQLLAFQEKWNPRDPQEESA
jgi:hypothetical protein